MFEAKSYQTLKLEVFKAAEVDTCIVDFQVFAFEGVGLRIVVFTSLGFSILVSDVMPNAWVDV